MPQLEEYQATLQDYLGTPEEIQQLDLRAGSPYVRNGKFYGVYRGGVWGYCDPKDELAPWKFLGGAPHLFRLEKTSIIVWYRFVFKSSNRYLYLPKFDGHKLTFIFDV